MGNHALRHFNTQVLEEHTGTWVIRALKVLYFADSLDAALEGALDGGFNVAFDVLIDGTLDNAVVSAIGGAPKGSSEGISTFEVETKVAI